MISAPTNQTLRLLRLPGAVDDHERTYPPTINPGAVGVCDGAARHHMRAQASSRGVDRTPAPLEMNLMAVWPRSNSYHVHLGRGLAERGRRPLGERPAGDQGDLEAEGPHRGRSRRARMGRAGAFPRVAGRAVAGSVIGVGIEQRPGQSLVLGQYVGEIHGSAAPLVVATDLQSTIGHDPGGARVHGQGPVPPLAALAVAGAVVAVQLDQAGGQTPALGQRLSKPHDHLRTGKLRQQRRVYVFTPRTRSTYLGL